MTCVINLGLEEMEKYSLHRCPIKTGCICDVVNSKNNNNNNDNDDGPYDWSFIDTVFCICLKNRNDRLKHSIEQFHKYGLCTRVLYHRPDVPSEELVKTHNLKEKGRYGCWEAHRQVTWIAKHLFNSRRNLIFEDDVLFVPKFTPQVLKKIEHHVVHQMEPNQWDLYYLGYMPVYANIPYGNNLWKLHCLMSHASIQNTDYINKFSEMKWIDNGIQYRPSLLGLRKKEIGPDSWAMNNAKQFGISPMIAVQTDMSSDAGVDKFKNIYESAIKFHGKHSKLVEFVFMKLIILLVLIAIVFSIFKSLTRIERQSNNINTGKYKCSHINPTT